jgi:hypothetical protein
MRFLIRTAASTDYRAERERDGERGGKKEGQGQASH